MPRHSAGARLWLHPERRDKAGRITHLAVWFIKDGRFSRAQSALEMTVTELKRRLSDTSTESTPRQPPQTAVIRLRSPSQTS